MTAAAWTVSGIGPESSSKALGTSPVTVRSSRKHLRLYQLRVRWALAIKQSLLAVELLQLSPSYFIWPYPRYSFEVREESTVNSLQRSATRKQKMVDLCCGVTVQQNYFSRQKRSSQVVWEGSLTLLIITQDFTPPIARIHSAKPQPKHLVLLGAE